MELTNPSLSIEKNHSETTFHNRIDSAESLVNKGDYPAALKIYHEILDQKPSSTDLFEIYKNMGNAYLKCGDADAAEESYNKASRLQPNHVSLLVNYGVLSIHRELYAEAKEKFVAALEQEPGNDFAWVGLSLVHRAFSDFDLARACLLRALDESPDNKMALTSYYQWCEEDGVEPSVCYVESFVEAVPNDPEAIEILKQFNSF